MLQLISLLLLAQPIPGGIPERVIFRDPLQGPTPVTDKWIIPPKIPDCRNSQEEEKALAQRANGELESCDPVSHDRAMRRR